MPFAFQQNLAFASLLLKVIDCLPIPIGWLPRSIRNEGDEVAAAGKAHTDLHRKENALNAGRSDREEAPK